MMAYLVGGGGGGGLGGGGGVSVGSEVHTVDYNFFLYHLLRKAHFCMFRGLLFSSCWKN